MASTEIKYFLGGIKTNSAARLSSTADTEIKASHEFSPPEFESIRAANGALLLYRNQLLFLDFVRWNLEEFFDLEERTLLHGLDKSQDPARSPDLDLNRCLLNFLSSVRAYLDHTETDLTRRFGEDNERYRRFQRLTAELYDNHFSYRFMYKFRNFAQHCGLPLDSFSHRSSSTSRTLQVAVSRSRLLGEFDWGKLRPEIERLPEKVELGEFAAVHVQHLTELHLSLCAEELPQVRRAAELVLSAAARVPKQEGIPVVLSVPTAFPIAVSPARGRQVTFDHFPLMVDMALHIAGSLSSHSALDPQ